MGPAVILNTTVMARGIQLRSAERPRHRDMHGTHAAHMYAHDCGLPASLTRQSTQLVRLSLQHYI